jgi:glycosyltransferase involved in cell wall biosynthesis
VSTPSLSLILTTYNWPQALQLVLASLEQQDDRDFEVLVADDGSGPDTADLIARFQGPGRLNPRHVWHPDQGFRAAEIRNRAAALARGAYLVFLDGDCLTRPGFIRRHRALAQPGWLVAGNRVLLSAGLTQMLLADPDRLAISHWGPARWLGARWRHQANRLLPLVYLPGRWWRRLQPDRWQGARTCNLGLWRADFLTVNGFDERYQGWGYEDSDLVIRLLKTGVARLDGRHATGVLHLWHPEQARDRGATNLARLLQVQKTGQVRALTGVDRHLP